MGMIRQWLKSRRLLVSGFLLQKGSQSVRRPKSKKLTCGQLAWLVVACTAQHERKKKTFLVNFLSKIQIWAHLWQKFYQKRGSLGERLWKIGCKLFTRRIWVRRKQNGGQWTRASWQKRVNVSSHPRHQFLVSVHPLAENIQMHIVCMVVCLLS